MSVTGMAAGRPGGIDEKEFDMFAQSRQSFEQNMQNRYSQNSPFKVFTTLARSSMCLYVHIYVLDICPIPAYLFTCLLTLGFKVHTRAGSH